MQEKRDWSIISKYRSQIMGVACIWVILHHNTFIWATELRPLQRMFAYGNCGVDMFLFLSGIGLYFAMQRKPSLLTFYKRRIARIIIPFLLIASPYWVWRDLFLHKGNFLLDITMLSFPLKGIISTWYIGAILVFYLFYPLVYKVLFEPFRLGRITLQRNTVAILLPSFMAGVCLVVKAIMPDFYDNIEIALTRSVVFLMGCAAGRFVYEKKPLRSEFLWCAFVFLVFYLFAFRETVSISSYWIRMSYAPMAVSIVLLLSVFFSTVRWKPLHSVLAYFGSRSLEIYLTHVLINNVYKFYFPEPVLDKARVLDYCCVIIVSIAAAELVHFLSAKVAYGGGKRSIRG